MTVLDRFFESYYGRRPVNATFIGVHEHDGAWPDCSPGGLGDLQADTEALIPALDEARDALGPEGAAAGGTRDARLDLELASGHLRLQAWELGAAHFQRGNPSWYTGEAAFGIIGLFLTDFAPLESRVASAVSRLEGLPAFLEQGREALLAGVADRGGRPVPSAWIGRAQRECRGLSAMLGEGLDMLRDEWEPDGVPDGLLNALDRARDVARGAAADFAAFLDRDLPASPEASVAAGDEALALHLREGHFVAEDAAEIMRYAEEEMDLARGRLQGHDAAADRAAVGALHPAAHDYLARFAHLRDEVKATAESLDLLTWPDFPIRFVPRPPWSRRAAPDLYFLYYRSPAAYGRPPVHEYLVAPLADTADEREAVLRTHNDAVIKLNHVIHHGSIGHHVQNWHASRAPSRVGRIAAVDCASRIAMLCGGTMAEGWACYATDLMKEVGFLTPLEERVELRGRIRMCARAVVDVELHSGRMSLDEAAAFYEAEAGMTRDASRAEAVKNSMFPGAAAMYLLGTDRIHRLRTEMSGLLGGAFDLRAFHDRLLSYGSIPVTRAAEHMVDEVRRGRRPVGSHGE